MNFIASMPGSSRPCFSRQTCARAHGRGLASESRQRLINRLCRCGTDILQIGLTGCARNGVQTIKHCLATKFGFATCLDLITGNYHKSI